MPELPEVESYKRDLGELLTGRRIASVFVDWPNQVAMPDVDTFQKRLSGQQICAVSRRGKYLLFPLSEGETLLIHLRMSGRLYFQPASAPADPHAHVVFQLVGDEELRFHDPRKFGRVYLVADPAEVVGQLGPEPLAEDFTLARWQQMLAGRRGRLKPLLLDQTFLAGLGNIYADEALYQAGIHPLRTADSLNADEVQQLYHAIRSILRRAIENKGTSFDAFYLDVRGEPGAFQSLLQVYGRAGEPCRRCGTAIERIVVGQRGTHVCRRCQPLLQ